MHKTAISLYTSSTVAAHTSRPASVLTIQALVKQQQLFSGLDVHHFGSIDKGLLAIEGRLVNGVTPEQADKAVNEELEKFLAAPVNENELQKVKNKTESMIAFEDMSVMNRANSLAMYELLGDAQLMNTELGKYQEVSVADIQEYSRQVFRDENSNTLFYHSK